MEKDQKLPGEISDAERGAFEAKAAQLAEREGVKVHALVMVDPNTHKRVEAYFREPNFETKLAALNKASMMGIYMGAQEVFLATLMKADSDALLSGEGPECDSAKLGAINYCISMVELMQDGLKKK